MQIINDKPRVRSVASAMTENEIAQKKRKDEERKKRDEEGSLMVAITAKKINSLLKKSFAVGLEAPYQFGTSHALNLLILLAIQDDNSEELKHLKGLVTFAAHNTKHSIVSDSGVDKNTVVIGAKEWRTIQNLALEIGEERKEYIQKSLSKLDSIPARDLIAGVPVAALALGLSLIPLLIPTITFAGVVLGCSAPLLLLLGGYGITIFVRKELRKKRQLNEIEDSLGEAYKKDTKLANHNLACGKGGITILPAHWGSQRKPKPKSNITSADLAFSTEYALKVSADENAQSNARGQRNRAPQPESNITSADLAFSTEYALQVSAEENARNGARNQRNSEFNYPAEGLALAIGTQGARNYPDSSATLDRGNPSSYHSNLNCPSLNSSGISYSGQGGSTSFDSSPVRPTENANRDKKSSNLIGIEYGTGRAESPMASHVPYPTRPRSVSKRRRLVSPIYPVLPTGREGQNVR